MGFKHTGVFPEQAVNWDFAMRDKIRAAGRPVSRAEPVRLHRRPPPWPARRPGRSVCHVDAAKGMVAWAQGKRAGQSGLDRPPRALAGGRLPEIRPARSSGAATCTTGLSWIRRRTGAGPGGEVWKLEEQLYGLVSQCVPILSARPLFFLLNSYTTGLSPAVMSYLLGTLLRPKFGGALSADEIGLPVTATGMVLPCGSTAIWQIGSE